MQTVPTSLSEAVSKELMGERVIWAASPDRWAYASKYWKTALFGVPFAAFAIFWTYEASQMSAKADSGFATFFPLWGLMFVVFGLSMLLSPLWSAWVAGNVYYVVTERRAVIFEKSIRLKIQSFTPTTVSGFERVSRGGSGGNIIFQRVSERSARGQTVKEVGFIGLSEYSEAEQALNKLVSLGKSA